MDTTDPIIALALVIITGLFAFMTRNNAQLLNLLKEEKVERRETRAQRDELALQVGKLQARVEHDDAACDQKIMMAVQAAEIRILQGVLTSNRGPSSSPPSQSA